MIDPHQTTRYQEDLLLEVSSYYSAKLEQHGDTPLGVDWNGEEGQITRFDQLCKVIDPASASFALNDLGCGYGAMLDYLKKKYTSFTYAGIDISPEMIKASKFRHASVPDAQFFISSEPAQVAEYGIASGIFNVRLGRTDVEWFDYIRSTLDILNRTSRLGFAFNCLTAYSDPDKKRDYLYYADPCQLFDFCKRNYSRQVALLHDYGLYEFTIIVRKNDG